MIAEANPENKAAIEYLGAFLLLAKNMDGFKGLVETYYGTEVLPCVAEVFPGSSDHVVGSGT